MMNIVNLMFNTVVIISVVNQDTIPDVKHVVRVSVDIWSTLLLIYLIVTLYRLIHYAKQKSIVAFETN